MRRRLAVCLLLAGTLCVWGVPPSSAAEIQTVGWWSRTATTDPVSEVPAPLPIPNPTTPDTVPVGAAAGDGTLVVEGAPDGAVSMAAALWLLADTESSPSLTLPISPGSTVSPQSVILACKAAATWTPPTTSPGRWETKPITDGQSCISGIIAEDLSTVSWGLQPLLRKHTLDIVLVPGTVADLPPGANGSTFRLVFDEPTNEMLEVVKGSSFVEGEGPVVVTPRPNPSSVSFDSPDLTPSPAVDFSPPPTVAAPTVEAPPPVAPSLEPQDLGPSVPRLEPASQLAALGDDSTARRLGFVLLLIGAAFGAWSHYGSGAVPVVATVGLGRFQRTVDTSGETAPPVGGLARFARPRTEPPVPLS